MNRTTNVSYALFQRWAMEFEACAVALSAVSPDRKLPVYYRDCAGRCDELAHALAHEPNKVAEASLATLHAMERCTAASRGTIHMFCKRAADLCEEGVSTLRELIAS